MSPRLPPVLLGILTLLCGCGGGSSDSSSSSSSGGTAATVPGGTTGAGSSTDSVTPAVGASGYTALWIPPALEGTTTEGVTTFNLSLAASSKQILSGAQTATYGYNGSDFWGPTLILNKGAQSRMVLQNNLAEATTTHWHGLLVTGAVDGGPHQMIAPGATWATPTFTVKNQAATYWYHPHLHGATQKHLTLGAGGLIIVRDADEAALALPRSYGIDDIPVMLTSRRFTTSSGTANQFQTTNTAYGDYLLANGVLNAEVTLPHQIVRLRLLNAEVEREYNVGFGDNRTFYVIGSDGGLLSAPLVVTRLIMAPGERYEILVDLNADTVGGTVDLKAYNGADSGLSFGFAGLEPATSGNFGSLLNYTTFNLLHIKVGATTASPVTTVPASLVLWTTTSVEYDTTALQWAALAGLGLSSMYLGFFAWYRGLSLAGVAYGSQVQQLQALLTLLWSALLLGESVTVGTVLAACLVIACVVWAQRSRGTITVAPEE